jgi:hypothetical protein
MSTNGTQHYSTKDCKEPGPYCPVEATVLGYYPNLGANAFLAAGFATCLIVLLITGIWKKTWGYSAALVAGCILEVAGMYTFKSSQTREYIRKLLEWRMVYYISHT